MGDQDGRSGWGIRLGDQDRRSGWEIRIGFSATRTVGGRGEKSQARDPLSSDETDASITLIRMGNPENWNSSNPGNPEGAKIMNFPILEESPNTPLPRYKHPGFWPENDFKL